MTQIHIKKLMTPIFCKIQFFCKSFFSILLHDFWSHISLFGPPFPVGDELAPGCVRQVEGDGKNFDFEEVFGNKNAIKALDLELFDPIFVRIWATFQI